MGGFPYLIFSKGDKVSAAASVGDERSPLATIAPLCIPPQGEDLTCRFGRRRTLSTGELRPLATPLRGGAPVSASRLGRSWTVPTGHQDPPRTPPEWEMRGG